MSTNPDSSVPLHRTSEVRPAGATFDAVARPTGLPPFLAGLLPAPGRHRDDAPGRWSVAALAARLDAERKS